MGDAKDIVRVAFGVEITVAATFALPYFRDAVVQPLCNALVANNAYCEVCLVLYATRKTSARHCLQRSNWTSDLKLFLSWIDAIPNHIEGSGRSALTECLSELMYMFQRPLLVAGDMDRVQKHCVLLWLSEDNKGSCYSPADADGVCRFSCDRVPQLQSIGSSSVSLSLVCSETVSQRGRYYVQHVQQAHKNAKELPEATAYHSSRVALLPCLYCIVSSTFALLDQAVRGYQDQAKLDAANGSVTGGAHVIKQLAVSAELQRHYAAQQAQQRALHQRQSARPSPSSSPQEARTMTATPEADPLQGGGQHQQQPQQLHMPAAQQAQMPGQHGGTPPPSPLGANLSPRGGPAHGDPLVSAPLSAPAGPEGAYGLRSTPSMTALPRTTWSGELVYQKPKSDAAEGRAIQYQVLCRMEVAASAHFAPSLQLRSWSSQAMMVAINITVARVKTDARANPHSHIPVSVMLSPGEYAAAFNQLLSRVNMREHAVRAQLTDSIYLYLFQEGNGYQGVVVLSATGLMPR